MMAKARLGIAAAPNAACFHGDHVLARVSGRDRRGRDEATIAEVIARNTQTIVGVYRSNTLSSAF